MPRVGFAPENKQVSKFDYPKLSLDKGEQKRIAALEEPFMEYVHKLRKPVLVDGKAVYETVENFGKTTEQMKTDFVGQPVCIGDYSVIKENGVDPKTCPACLIATQSDAIGPPVPRYAMHVVEYTTVPGTFDVADPYQVQTRAWVFAYSRFEEMIEFSREWGSLQKHDLLLGPCENKQWQKYKVSISAKAEWLLSDDRKKLTAQVFNNNKSPDITTLIGRKVSKEMLEEMCDDVMTAYRIATGRGPAPETSTAAAETAAGMDIDDLLDPSSPDVDTTPSGEVTSVAEVSTGTSQPDTDDFQGMSVVAPDDDPAVGSGPELDIDDILNDL